MEIILKKPFAANTAVKEFDVRQIKKVLNVLGYYQPYEKTGITGMPDKDVFVALKSFQKDHGLEPTGTAIPGDDTIKALNMEYANNTQGKYIWRTVGDDKVRPEHKALDGTLRDFSDSPDPGQQFNCRCWAEPIEDGIRPFYPELLLIPALKSGHALKVITAFYKNFRNTDYTAHGNQRARQRDITEKEIQEALKSAKNSGAVITKIGKYGTPQNHHVGSNGVTVVKETAGRNAGKIITVWRHR